MIRILCYGDSNTWGHDPGTWQRLETRWTQVLTGELGLQAAVLEEGLNGRTTVWDDPIEGDKNGKKQLVCCLDSQRPLDLIILMLGTNDLKMRFNLSAWEIALGAGCLVQLAKDHFVRSQLPVPRILLVSPVWIHPDIIHSSLFCPMFGGLHAHERSKEFAQHYAAIADEYGCDFFDAASVAAASPIDGVHLDAAEHEKLGKALACKVRQMMGI
ncbi:MAG: SGNH/GDSL hydrolase family protein [Christensenellales bacterium]|jgi:lysophospholipase L1-like esterase